jgi:hypothetical protein
VNSVSAGHEIPLDRFRISPLIFSAMAADEADPSIFSLEPTKFAHIARLL